MGSTSSKSGVSAEVLSRMSVDNVDLSLDDSSIEIVGLDLAWTFSDGVEVEKDGHLGKLI